MALFESYERRIDKINEVLNSYGIASLEGTGRLQSGQRNSADLFRERMLGLHHRCSDRDQERLQKRSRRSCSNRRRPSGFLYSGICC